MAEELPELPRLTSARHTSDDFDTPEYTLEYAFADFIKEKRFVVMRQEGTHKVPYTPRTGRRASHSDPATWGTYKECIRAQRRRGYDYVAIALGDLGNGERLIGIDYDEARNAETGEPAPWMAEYLHLARTYVEVSPSGTGYKAFGYGLYNYRPVTHKLTIDAPLANPAGTSTHKEPSIEFYTEKRFFVLAGKLAPDIYSSELYDLQHEMNRLDRLALGRKQRHRAPKPQLPIDVHQLDPVTERELRLLLQRLHRDSLLRPLFDRGIGPGGKFIHDRSRCDFLLTLLLRERLGFEDHEIAAILVQNTWGQLGGDEPPLREPEVRDYRIGRLLAAAGTAKPHVQIAAGDKMVAMQAIVPHIKDVIYATDNRAVRVSRTRGLLRLRPINNAQLRLLIEDRIRLVRSKVDREGTHYEEVVDCTQDFANVLLANVSELPFRQVEQLSHNPLFVNGEIVTSDYHEESKTLLDLNPDLLVALHKLPTAPTRADALTAYRFIRHCFRGFKGRVPDHKILEVVMTAVFRSSLHMSPIVAIDGNEFGVGKTDLCHALAHLCSLDEHFLFNEEDKVETKKQIKAGVMTGAPVLIYDNCTSLVDQPLLASLVTSRHSSSRVLGSYEIKSLLNTYLFMINGKKLAFKQEMARRHITLYINDPNPNPHGIKYDYVLLDEIHANRPQLIAAVLTIAQAWWLVKEDHPAITPTVGSFQGWAALVAAPVQWLTGHDPSADITAQVVGAEDNVTKRDAYGRLLRRCGTEKFHVGDVLDIPTMWQDVLDLQPNATPTAKKVGEWIQHNLRDVVGQGHVLNRIGRDKDGVIWRFKSTAPRQAPVKPRRAKLILPDRALL